MPTRTETVESQAPATYGEETLSFLGESVFAVAYWQQEGLHFLQPHELDLVASAASVEEAAQKLGQMILDLYIFLAEEVDDPSESEREALQLIRERVVPPLLKHHRRRLRRHAAAWRRLQRLRKPTEWRLGPPSTRDESAQPLSA